MSRKTKHGDVAPKLEQVAIGEFEASEAAEEAALEEAAKRFDTMPTTDNSGVSSAQYLRKMKGE
jgi:hypothetical protein